MRQLTVVLHSMTMWMMSCLQIQQRHTGLTYLPLYV